MVIEFKIDETSNKLKLKKLPRISLPNSQRWKYSAVCIGQSWIFYPFYSPQNASNLWNLTISHDDY